MWAQTTLTGVHLELQFENRWSISLYTTQRLQAFMGTGGVHLYEGWFFTQLYQNIKFLFIFELTIDHIRWSFNHTCIEYMFSISTIFRTIHNQSQNHTIYHMAHQSTQTLHLTAIGSILILIFKVSKNHKPSSTVVLQYLCTVHKSMIYELGLWLFIIININMLPTTLW